MAEVIYAGGNNRDTGRGDGNGGFLKRGYYVRELTGIGPLTRPQAELVATIYETRVGPGRLHESELYRGEIAALRSLRKKGIVTQCGLFLTREALGKDQ